MNIHKHIHTYKTLYAILWVAFLSISQNAYADSCTPGDGFNNPVCSPDFKAVLQGIADWVMIIGIPVVIFFIILTGIYFVTAQGNEEKLKKARTMLVWTFVGTLIITGAAVIAGAINEFATSLGNGS